ncbi:arylsulfatase [Abditibacteriota bacterium]|nr:arylsulfatase [Abditibacteriota bacterium]
MALERFNPIKAALVGAALFSIVSARPVRAKERPPNVVIILTDDQGYADVGCFGAKGLTTPNLDQLAREGRRFTNFHVPQPICTASRAGLITGCYPSRIGFKGALGPNSKIGISDGETTLPQIFKAKGYATGMVGKWHLGDAPQFLPTQRGFDEYFGLPYSHDMWPRHPEFPQSYPPLPLIEGTKVINPDLQPSDLTQLTTMYTERAVSFIDRNKDRPFFLYLAHNLPHVPLFVSDKFKGKSQRGLYGDVIEEIDWSVGEVTKALARNHLDKNTLVIFATDNGPWLSYGDNAGSAYPLREGKHTNWEGGTRVPCIMRWPGKIPAGTVSGDMAMTIDLLPTLAHQLDVPLPKHSIDGVDIWPLMSGQPGARNPHKAYYFYYGNNELQAVTSGDGKWKLILPHTYVTLNGRPGGTGGKPAPYDNRTIERAELYDLVNNENESHDVATQHPDVVERLQRDAENAREELGDGLTHRIGKGVRSPGQVSAPASPQIVGKVLTISCDVTSEALNGVILAQGGSRNGYALHLKDGHPCFSVRHEGRLYSISVPQVVRGRFSLQARLEKEGGLTLSVNGTVVVNGKAQGLFTAQPTDELSIGQDTITAVGDYKAPFPLEGKVENVKVVAK